MEERIQYSKQTVAILSFLRIQDSMLEVFRILIPKC